MISGTNTISRLNSLAAQAAEQDSKDGKENAVKIETATALFQTKMGRLQMLLKVNEALSKTLKALGDAIKGIT